jgi:hypothetical protein
MQRPNGLMRQVLARRPAVLVPDRLHGSRLAWGKELRLWWCGVEFC